MARTSQSGRAMPIVILSVVTAMFLIVGGDAAGKVLGGMGFAPFFVAWARFALAVIVLAPLSGMQRHEWRLMLDWRLILRAALIAGGIACILTALKTEPMANAFAGFFIGPVVAFVLSALILKERVTVLRAGLLAVSFAGVLIVVRPGFGVSVGMGFAVLAGCLHGGYLVTTRWLAPGFRPRFLLLSQLAIGTVLLAPFAVGGAGAFSAVAMGLLTISALGSAIGNLLLVQVNRTTPAGVIAPLIYSQLIAAMVLGLLVFGDWPDRWTLVGLVVIIAAGVGSALAAGRGR
ncbi:DMT family transporter [Yoonia sp. R2331]|uniref:DMT family transporter n=1 Tax=Yoonia sp. R2331 TaxID=3237238 RepID=UPI0034E5FA69